jgi:spermidine synthase
LLLYEAEGYRWVCSSTGAIQSAMQLADPTALVLSNHRAMLIAALLPPRLDAVLDLGAGCGGFSRHLHARVPAPRVVAVEQNPAMIALATAQFALPKHQHIHIDDAPRYLAASEEHFDLILCDLFLDRRAPEAMSEPAFFTALHRRLAPQGALALNTLPGSAQELTSSLRYLRRNFAAIGIVQFSDLGNVVVLASQTALPDTASWLQRLADSPYAGSQAMRGWIEAMVRFNKP